MNPLGYIISMRRAKERFEHVQQVIAKCPISCHRWDAVDGRLLSEASVADVYRRALHRPHYPFKLTRGEIGCFLSHRSVWQQIVDSGLPGALVLEDDIDLLDGFAEAFRFGVEHAPPCSYVQFQTRNIPAGGQEIAESGEYRLIRPEVAPVRAMAQWITRQAAEQLVETTRLFDRPIDTFVQMRWLHGVDVLVLTPPRVREISGELGGSVINAQKRARYQLPQLSRDWKRFVYRCQVRTWCRRLPKAA